MEICFVPDNKYGKYVEAALPERTVPGPIIDMNGRYRGEHPGIIHFTVGQRRGLGIGTNEPLYVVAIEPERNTVIVGSDDDLFQNELVADGLNLVALPSLPGPLRCAARVRSRMTEAPATIWPAPEVAPDAVRVVFDEPQRAITPGQAIVFYDGDVVMGGATIASTGTVQSHPIDARPGQSALTSV